MPKISVIVPVYNTEKYLHRCIDSILSQTFTDFEVLLIDDGSTDSSGEICDEYAAKDARVRVFHKENGGASTARIIGLDNAKGEWISFVDADDWLDISLYHDMLNKAQKENSDMVACGVAIERHGSESLLLECPIDYTSIQSLQDFRMIEGTVYSSLWNKLIRREYIDKHQLSFDNRLHMWDDLWFILRARLYNPIISILSTSYYHYRTDSLNSITKQSAKRKIVSQIHCANMISDFISRHSDLSHNKPIGVFLKFRAKDALFDMQEYHEWRKIHPETHGYIWRYKCFYGVSRCLQYYLVAKGGMLGVFFLKSYKILKRICNK